MKEWSLDLGANLLPDGSISFKVWAPLQSSLKINVHKSALSPMPMEKDGKGYFYLQAKGISAGDRYTYILPSGIERSDPVSRFLPQGPLGPSTIIDAKHFSWKDASWKGLSQEELIFYECHVGTFTPQGTFQGVIDKLPYLKELGVTCLELMPIAEFAGNYGWGYDPLSLYSPHHAYGEPHFLKELVNACHQIGIAVCLDVVYNHFGPEGCYLGDFGPYWTERYQTPWGKGINYDGAYSDEVRHFILQNALYWIAEYHVDALRLDALHALFDFSAAPFLQQLSASVQEFAKLQNRKIHLIAESNLNDSRLIRPRTKGGSGLQAFWNEDFHHCLHVALTSERDGYYQDFKGVPDLKKTLAQGVVYQGQYSKYRKLSHGNSFRGTAPYQLVAFTQNHDQIGNRPSGDRLCNSISYEAQKMTALLLTLSPYLPLLFMGQEYGEEAPFQYFVHYEDQRLMTSIHESRKKEFSDSAHYPDESAFLRSKLIWDHEHPQKKALLSLYRQLIALRKNHLFKPLHRKEIKVYSSRHWLAWSFAGNLGCICNFSKETKQIELPFSMTLHLHTDQKEFAGKEALLFDTTTNKLSLPAESGAIFI